MKVPSITYPELAEPEGLVKRTWNMLSDESYFLLTDVGRAFSQLDAAWDAAARYFSKPLNAKMEDHIALSDDHHGYVPIGEEGKSGEQADYKESYDCGWVARDQYTGWPDTAGFGDAVSAIWQEMRRVGDCVAHLFSMMLGEHPEYLRDRATSPPSQLRLLHYMGDDPSRIAVDWHTDYECFTLLLTTDSGLEVRRPDSSVVEVPHQPSTLVVSLGDLMEVLTNGGLSATPHRVRPLLRERYSIAYFYALDWSARIAPLPTFVGAAGEHYPAITAGDHLLRRTIEGFGYRRDQELPGSSDPKRSGPSSPYFYHRGSLHSM